MSKKVQVLLDAKKIFDDLGVPFFLSCGTLLGAIREGKIIDHDTDVDLGVMGDEWWFSSDPLKIKTLTNLANKLDEKFKRCDFLFYDGNPIVWGYKRDGLTLDIAFYYREGNKVWKGINNGYLVKEEFDEKHFEKFDKIKMYGEDFLIPSHAERILELRYTKDWRTPDPNWIKNWKTTIKSIVGHFPGKGNKRFVY